MASAVASINQALLKAKLFYFFFVSAMNSLLPYLFLYYKHVLFLSPKQVTILMAVRPMCLIIAAPLLGTVADKANRYRPILLMCLAGYIITYGLIYAIEPVKVIDCLQIVTARASSSNSSTSKSIYSKKDDYYAGNLMEDSIYSWPFSPEKYSSTEEITKNIFQTMLVLTIIGELFSSPAYTFADVYTLQTLEGDNIKYGYQILPGTIGTAVISAILILVTHSKLLKVTDPCEKSLVLSDKPFFITFMVFIALSFIIAVFFQYHLIRKDDKKHVSDSCHCKIFDALRLMCNSALHSSFLFVVLLCGIGDGAKVSFTSTFLSDLGHKHKHKHIMPLISACHFLSHTVFLALSPYFIKKFGHLRIVTAGVLVYGLSFIVYGIINDPVWVFIIEPLDGVARMLARVAIITYVGSPPRIGAALQGLTHALYLGLGTSIGTFICGWLIQKYGYVLVFIILGVFFLTGFGFCLAIDHFFPSEMTIYESFATSYSQLGSADSESDFDFLLEDMNKNDNKEETKVD